MSIETTESSNLFGFMVVRHPRTIVADALRRDYIHDEVLGNAGRASADVFSPESDSEIGKLVYRRVFCPEPLPAAGTTVRSSEVATPSLRTLNLETTALALTLLPRHYAACPNADPPDAGATPIAIESLAGRHYVDQSGLIQVLPERVEDLALPWGRALKAARAMIDEAGSAAEIRALPDALAKLFDVSRLHEALFYKGLHHQALVDHRRRLFDNLYLLYVLRRAFEVSLEPTIEALRTLHVIEALAIDGFIATLRARGGPSASDGELYAALQRDCARLAGWDFKKAVEGLPLVPSRARLRRLLQAVPVVHPLFARLHRFRTPFNAIKPIGIGDLKVVKQTSLGYRVGEIAHIDNVLKGEAKTRTHRRLEKSEDTFSFSSVDESETTRDTQSTSRFELKREADSVLNTVMNANANLSVTYDQKPVVATVSGGVAYSQASSDQTKVTENFVRDVVDKAVQRVRASVTQQRSATRLFETEETNVHAFENKDGTSHVSGIYRWVDQRYRAQVYNFGKRLMFEFVVPEPAAFLVEARLRAFEATLDVPQQPSPPTPKTVSLGFLPGDIDKSRFRELQVAYGLSDFAFPEDTRTVVFKDMSTNQTLLQAAGIASDDTWWSRDYECRIDAVGYEITRLKLFGSIFYQDLTPANVVPRWRDRNLFTVSIDGAVIRNYDFSTTEYKAMYVPNDDIDLAGAPHRLTRESVTLTLGFQEVSRYALQVQADLALTADALLDWQNRVYQAIIDVERERVERFNSEQQLAYDARMAEYRNRLRDLKAVAASELLGGSSSDANRRLVVDELKKHCLTMIANEFDADASDDLVSQMHALGTRTVSSVVRPFRVTEGATTTAGFQTGHVDVVFPSIDISVARSKGRYVQFLEQAFEWQHLAYVMYPYFWAHPARWVETMARTDPGDPQFSAFLRAGSARVLVAVTPGYEDAVAHFCATGEPWDGGPSPAIGDPLFLPINDELRRQQDDLFGGTPDGEPWEFTLPTALVYLEGSSTPLPPPPTP